MEAMEVIKTRRSIRKFTDQPVTKEEIEEIVAAAAYAPSWKNTQTARYTFVSDPEVKAQIANECMMEFSKNTETLNGAPAVVVLSTIVSRSGYERDGSFTTALGTHWQSFDAGIAAEAFCLAAHELGLGTVIMGIFDGEKVAKAISLPEGQQVSALITIGHPAEEPKAPVRKSVSDLLRSI